jgi:predicted O-linked N-acetylglucosamine transferase (SPINDLY family)
MSDSSIQDLMNRAIASLRARDENAAVKLFREVLARQPRNADALHLLGCVVSRAGRTHEGIGLIRQALAVDPRQTIFLNNLGLMLGGAGQIQEAVETFQKAIAINPEFADAYHNLGNALSASGQGKEAIRAFERALQIRPDDPQLHYNLGNVYLRVGNLIAPGGATERSVAYEQAAASYARATALKPDFSIAFNNRGAALQALDRMVEAAQAWERAAELAPNPDSFYNLGRAYYEEGRYDEALSALDRSIQLRPNFSGVHNNRGALLREMGRLDDAIASFERSISLDPDNTAATCNRLFTMQYHPAFSAARILKEHERWAARFAAPTTIHSNSRDPDRRLRIGYVSPNFWGHCQALFMLPLLRHHNRERFEIFCYADQSINDSTTARIRALTGGWRNISGMQTAAVAEQIRADQIDILVDLTLHMAKCRLPVFALKPAPEQITWLGYPGTTGLEAMDYRISDPWLDPTEQTEVRYTERTLHLPRTFWCIDPTALTNETPEISELPARASGRITFGCLNNFCKINEPQLALWARVLDRVPGSRMMLLAPQGSTHDWVIQKLGKRIDFFERSLRPEYLRAYQKIDIGLDTAPYNGHTTSLDSFWMGVPVVTTIGNTVVGRAGYSQLCNLGLPELAAAENDRFVEIAVALANDLPRLARLRADLRQRMERSPLMQAAAFARDIESVFREVWSTWCKKL